MDRPTILSLIIVFVIVVLAYGYLGSRRPYYTQTPATNSTSSASGYNYYRSPSSAYYSSPSSATSSKSSTYYPAQYPAYNYSAATVYSMPEMQNETCTQDERGAVTCYKYYNSYSPYSSPQYFPYYYSE